MTTDAWRSRVSQPAHRVRTERGIFVPTRDGTRLACDVYRPDVSGRFPALLLSLEIKGQETTADDPIWLHLGNAVETRHTIHHDARHASYLLVLVIPR